jgi:hypothetical protein
MSQDKFGALDNIFEGIFREPPPISTNLEPPPSTASNQPTGEEPAVLAVASAVQTPAVDSPTDAESSVRRAEQAKSLLAGLDLDTAIRLRWAMRDIRGKRTKLLPISENDLAALIDLGFVEVREGIPKLTGLGVLVLD